jgi:HK97 family phage portal protein/HK97 family phage major capsid protein
MLNLPLEGIQADLQLGSPYNLGSLTSMFGGSRTNSGQVVTPERALRSAAVLACVNILCSDLASLPLNLYRRTPQGAILATDHPLFRLLHDAPNQWQTSMELRESMILDVLCFGQSFVEKIIGPEGVERLYPLSAGRMVFANPLSMFLPPDPPLMWRYADPTSGARFFLSDDVWTIRMLAPGGTVDGQSLILLAREAIGLALAAEEQGARLFSNGVQTDLTLSADDIMDEDSKKQLRESFMSRYAGAGNAWMPLLLEGGLKAARIGLTAQESQYIEARSFQLADIARIFRIPDVLLGISGGKTATFASAEQFFLSYVKHTLGPWCQRIEQSIHRDLLAPSEAGDYFVKHDLDSLTRADLQTRYAAHAAGITAGFLTRNEARTMEHLPTLPGLDEPLSPLNMGSGNKPATRLANQLATNAVAHEAKLLADGKSRADVYGKLLPGYLAAKTGLSSMRGVLPSTVIATRRRGDGRRPVTRRVTHSSLIAGWSRVLLNHRLARNTSEINRRIAPKTELKMNLSEIQLMRQTCRAKLEDLLGRTSSRDLSTEESQMFTDLKAEGERLASLESRYSVLESFDQKPAAGLPVIHRPVVTVVADRTASFTKAIDGYLRSGTMATDVPLQIQQSPISGAAAAVPTDVVASIIQGINDFDIAARLGIQEFSRDTTNPLVVTMQTTAPAATVYVEGAAPTQSTPPTYLTVTLAGARYSNLTKYSIESRMNTGIDIVSSVVGALALGQIQSQNAAFMASFKAAMQANTAALVNSTGDSPADAYSFFSRLKYAQGYFWQNSPNNHYLLSPSDLLVAKNTRDTQGRPLFDDAADTILGKPYVVHPDADRVYYGNFGISVCRSRTPLYLQTFLELCAQAGLIGVSSYQFADWKFFAPPTYQPIVFGNLDAAGA